MSVYDFLVDFAIASALILVGQFLRAKIKFFQEFFIPASMLAGFIGLLLGERFLNVVHFSSGASSYAGALIIVVFTVVGLNGFSKGQKGGADSTVKRVLSFTMYRNVIMFIQFALGIAVTLTVVTWLVPDINPGFGVLMASGSTGGHGTAAAVGSTFNDVYGWAEATDLGMTFATVGILSGVFGGLIWIKIATKKGWTAYVKDFKYISGDMRTGHLRRPGLAGTGTSPRQYPGPMQGRRNGPAWKFFKCRGQRAWPRWPRSSCRPVSRCPVPRCSWPRPSPSRRAHPGAVP